MTINHEFIPGVVGRLEVIYEVLDLNNWAIICHPHPLYKGSMRNKVITTVAQACKHQNVSWISFNFRGVGSSEGQYLDLLGAYLDAVAVLNWLQANFCRPNWAIGFSFGAYIAQQLAIKQRVGNLLLLAPAVARMPFVELSGDYKTKVLQGEIDTIAKLDDTLAWIKQQPVELQLVVLEQASHFFHGKLHELRQYIVAILSES
jgi:alpha/beta superfamily hydrolase